MLIRQCQVEGRIQRQRRKRRWRALSRVGADGVGADESELAIEVVGANDAHNDANGASGADLANLANLYTFFRTRFSLMIFSIFENAFF